jgi:dsRNA-specific ribonuclease
MELGKGTGRSKKQAETAAALEAMREKRWQENAADALKK